MKKHRVEFKGQIYILVGEEDGAIATEEQYKHFLTPFAHLYPNGDISRHGKLIGTIADLGFLGEYKS